jgi:hypothetical protein
LRSSFVISSLTLFDKPAAATSSSIKNRRLRPIRFNRFLDWAATERSVELSRNRRYAISIKWGRRGSGAASNRLYFDS